MLIFFFFLGEIHQLLSVANIHIGCACINGWMDEFILHRRSYYFAHHSHTVLRRRRTYVSASTPTTTSTTCTVLKHVESTHDILRKSPTTRVCARRKADKGKVDLQGQTGQWPQITFAEYLMHSTSVLLYIYVLYFIIILSFTNDDFTTFRRLCQVHCTCLTDFPGLID